MNCVLKTILGVTSIHAGRNNVLLKNSVRGWKLVDNAVSKIEQAAYKATFDLLDTDKDGMLTVNDLKKFLEKISGALYDATELDKLVKSIAPDGKIRKEDFVKIAMPGKTIEVMKEAGYDGLFVKYDKDKDGKISADEINEIMKDAGDKRTKEDIASAMTKFDKDSDGFITRSEFSDFAKNFLTKN